MVGRIAHAAIIAISSFALAACSASNSFIDPTGTCNLLTRSEIGTRVRDATAFQSSEPIVRSCTYSSQAGSQKHLVLIVRTYATDAEAMQWLLQDAERFGVPVDAAHYRFQSNGNSSAAAVHGRIAVSLDDVGPFTSRDSGALEVLAETAARRASMLTPATLTTPG